MFLFIIFTIRKVGLQEHIKMVESEWNKDPQREKLVLFIGYLSVKEKTRKRSNE